MHVRDTLHLHKFRNVAEKKNPNCASSLLTTIFRDAAGDGKGQSM